MEEMMGALIQTKGTQRLAKWFNQRFDDSAAPTGLAGARTLTNTVAGVGTSLPNMFATAGLSLLNISDNLIAQNAGANWPTDMTDFLYPSTTLTTTTAAGGAASATLNFTFPAGFAAIPAGCPLAVGAAVSSLAPANNLTAAVTIPKGTVVGAVHTTAGSPNFSVDLQDRAIPPNPVNVSVKNANEMISFSKTGHEQLVRRWRWYLGFDLTTQNHTIIRNAISSALAEPSVEQIFFQAVEDIAQRALVSAQTKLNKGTDELDKVTQMYILLLTQSTTAPYRLDPQ
jgi:hypothetical protein